MRKSLAELKNSDTYKEIFAELRAELTLNKTVTTMVPVKDILEVYRHLLLEYIESENWTVSEWYCQGDTTAAHWGWLPTGPIPNFVGIHELGQELGKAFINFGKKEDEDSE